MLGGCQLSRRRALATALAVTTVAALPACAPRPTASAGAAPLVVADETGWTDSDGEALGRSLAAALLAEAWPVPDGGRVAVAAVANGTEMALPTAAMTAGLRDGLTANDVAVETPDDGEPAYTLTPELTRTPAAKEPGVVVYQLTGRLTEAPGGETRHTATAVAYRATGDAALPGDCVRTEVRTGIRWGVGIGFGGGSSRLGVGVTAGSDRARRRQAARRRRAQVRRACLDTS